MRRRRKDHSVTVDIGIPEARWRDVSEPEVRAYLMNSVEQAVELFIKRLEKDKEPVRADDFRADLAKVKSEFLGLPSDSGSNADRPQAGGANTVEGDAPAKRKTKARKTKAKKAAPGSGKKRR